MLVYRVLCDCDLKYNNHFSESCGKICFTPFIAKMARYIFELIMLVCSFHVKVYLNVFLGISHIHLCCTFQSGLYLRYLI